MYATIIGKENDRHGFSSRQRSMFTFFFFFFHFRIFSFLDLTWDFTFTDCCSLCLLLFLFSSATHVVATNKKCNHNEYKPDEAGEHVSKPVE